ncbi:hypothetical protein AW27_024705 [Streptomyces sp. PCS3-D2]|uniref:hypothetical protein n=1 Tax=Streptomyces sp. PCS3-D2 TaxID=1460244 RepID=UPI0012FF1EF6|nr:hypothetical protein [Streptomyces sp. PCS3-D2]WKV74431.1 hypothetical protein AW27_024705 [Streptomyces sp. PCS3-D2]
MADRTRHRFRTGHTWVASIASLTALAFSVYNFVEARESPQTVVTLPMSLKMIRSGDATSLFLQPTVFTRFDTEDVEIVTDVQIRLRPKTTRSEPKFFWEQNVQWWVQRGGSASARVVDKTSVWYEFASDPTPFVVTQSDPKQPVMQFTTHGWTLKPDRFEGTLTVERASTGRPIRLPFCLVIRSEDISNLMKGDGWYEWRTDVPGRQEGGCYHWYA